MFPNWKLLSTYLVKQMDYKLHTGGYLVRNNKALFVHHNKFDKWTPPGGHIEEGETPEEALIREFEEETGLKVELISALPQVFAGDDNATPLPAPFYMDVERDGFDVPHIGLYYYVREVGEIGVPRRQESEAHAIDWFGKDDLQSLQTFDQVRAVATFALDNYPKA